MIGLVTDSSSQIPDELARRYAVEVVPLTVSLDGIDHLEGVDLDADAFYDAFVDGTPEVLTSQPSPGLIADRYRRLVERGCEAICSVHIGAEFSGTINSAGLAAEEVDVPVRIVDTNTVSFGITCAVWEAAKVIADGGDVDAAAKAAEAIVDHVASVFLLGAVDLAKAGGRLAIDGATDDAVYAMKGSDLEVIGQVNDLESAADLMAGHIAHAADQLPVSERINVAVGAAERTTLGFWDLMEDRVRPLPSVGEVVRYRVGPSVGAHSGPGTVGAFFFPGGASSA